jgi:hypothetical protein
VPACCPDSFWPFRGMLNSRKLGGPAYEIPISFPVPGYSRGEGFRVLSPCSRFGALQDFNARFDCGFSKAVIERGQRDIVAKAIKSVSLRRSFPEWTARAVFFHGATA